MNEQVLQAIINTLENEILNLEVQRYLDETRIEDAGNRTGNAGADDALVQQRQVSVNRIAMFDRQLAVRRKRVAELKKQLPEPAPMLMLAREAPVQYDEPTVPPETANAKQMPDMVKD